MPLAEWEAFYAWYSVLACQFHCRVIGQAVRLAVRDNKTRLLGLIPILQRHLLEDLRQPVLAPLARFFEENGIVFDHSVVVDVDRLRPLIRDDAF
jgi:aminoglycoside/choline kinase family phosphotransferase